MDLRLGDVAANHRLHPRTRLLVERCAIGRKLVRSVWSGFSGATLGTPLFDLSIHLERDPAILVKLLKRMRVGRRVAVLGNAFAFCAFFLPPIPTYHAALALNCRRSALYCC